MKFSVSDLKLEPKEQRLDVKQDLPSSANILLTFGTLKRLNMDIAIAVLFFHFSDSDDTFVLTVKNDTFIV